MNITRQEQNGTLDLRLEGNFSFTDHEAFRDLLDQMENPEIKRVNIHLEHITFMDSAAMGMLLLAREETNKFEKVLTLAGASGQVKKMFDLANFQNFFTLR